MGPDSRTVCKWEPDPRDCIWAALAWLIDVYTKFDINQTSLAMWDSEVDLRNSYRSSCAVGIANMAYKENF